ncbi:hypothetical protein [Nitrosomonas sp.]|uniref:hypothetical protein n=1 Tax=Nitrosomonas sp. TaxID=42353 RepID=UPI0025D1678B|nr:hypothetical protein [Nitrosomonas sp.]
MKSFSFLSTPVKKLIEQDYPELNYGEYFSSIEFEDRSLLVETNIPNLIPLLNKRFYCVSKTKLSFCQAFVKIIKSKENLIIETSYRKTICLWNELSIFFVKRNSTNKIIQAGSFNQAIGSSDPLDDSLTAEINTLIYFFIEREILLEINYLYRDYLFLHASCVYNDMSKLVFLGPSYSGKTTLASAFESLGWQFLSDDIIAIHRITKEIKSFPKKKHLREGTRNLINNIHLSKIAKKEYMNKPNTRGYFLCGYNQGHDPEVIPVTNLADTLNQISQHLIIQTKMNGEEKFNQLFPIFDKWEFFEIRSIYGDLTSTIEGIIQ